MAAFSSFGWTGRSGQQIGMADEYPYDKYGPSFTADEVHGQKYDPNAPNSYAVPGQVGEVPVDIQDDAEWFDYAAGSNGWILDNLHDPWHGDDAGTSGHNPPMGAAVASGPDYTHAMDIYQLAVPGNHGINFYGKTIEDNEVYNWASSSRTTSTRGSASLDGRFDTANWPEPFDANTVAPELPVVRPTERIPMNRMAEDDRPVYRQLAIPGQNTKASGWRYNPTYDSNVPLRNVKPLPAAARTPTPPWTQEEQSSPDNYDFGDVDVFGGMALQ